MLMDPRRFDRLSSNSLGTGVTKTKAGTTWLDRDMVNSVSPLASGERRHILALIYLAVCQQETAVFE